ncbi:MAG: hypothetical protein AAFQ36_11590 [Pseudomonadota bacterium]
MEPVTKIATCSYCGTRSTLVFDSARHELVCPACRAPLHVMKPVPKPVEHVAPKAKAKPVKPYKPSSDAKYRVEQPWQKPKKKKKRKSFLKKAFDEVEDLFDLFD